MAAFGSVFLHRVKISGTTRLEMGSQVSKYVRLRVGRVTPNMSDSLQVRDLGGSWG